MENSKSKTKICCFCNKKMKNEEEWRIIHKLCFDRYKDVQKTPETYIFMTGKYKGKTYAYVAENHKKYIKWIIDQDFKDDSPMHFIKGYCKKFTKEEHEKNKKVLEKDEDNKSIYESSDDEDKL